MNSTLIRGAVLAAAFLATSGCNSDSGPTGPVAGPVRVVLTSPNTDDGAVMFQVIGVVDSVVVPAGLTLYQTVPGPNVIRAIVTGSIPPGSNLLTLYVPDVGKASSISTQVLQVAGGPFYASRPVGAYSLEIMK